MNHPKRVLYANLFCPTLHYPALDHLLDVKSQMKKGDILYLCFWDQESYGYRKFSSLLSSTKTYSQKVKEVVQDISAFLTSQGVPHEIVYMSDAFKRLLADEQLNELLFFILSKITIGHIEDTYDKIKYRPVRPLAIHKIIYMVADYMIGAHFTKLFPELSPSQVTDFYTGERFKAVLPKIEEAITEKGIIVNHPRIVYVRPIPILNYSSGNWISITMSKNEVEREIRKEYSEGFDYEQAQELLNMMTKLLGDDDFLTLKKGEFIGTNVQSLKAALPSMNCEESISVLTENFYRYLKKAKDSLEHAPDKGLKKINYVRDSKNLKAILRVLNPSKMDILKLCDGTRTIHEIVEKSPMKESSTRSYLSRLKAENIITDDSKPRRKVDEVLISFN